MNSQQLQNLSPDMAKLELVAQPMKIIVGSAKNFKGIHGPGDYYNRPLMVDSWSQSSDQGFLHAYEMVFKDVPTQREKDLKEKIKALEETLRNHTELLTKIHATSGLLDQHLSQIESDKTMNNNNNDGFNDTNSVYYLNKTTQKSPQIVNTINSTQQNCSPPAESFKYRIIAEGNNNEEPIEIQLAEENYSSNLNSSAESGRLEICLAAEENSETKAEYNALTSQPSTPTEHQNFIKKRMLAAEQYISPATNSTYSNESFNASSSNMQQPQQQQQQQPAIEKHYANSNNVLKTPNMQNKNISNNGPLATGADFSPLIEAAADLENVLIPIGPNQTRIPAKIYHNMNWTSASNATRRLLMTIFDRKVLATHSMTGKPSPAFRGQGKPVKQMLDPLIISDIVYVVTRKCNVSEKVVRNSITSKCADENKTMKLRMKKRKDVMSEMNKENHSA